jgi:RHS repeat-associated protein
MGRYVETYDYDPSGNLVTLKHVGSDPSNPGWSRAYVYAEPSLIEPGKASNRLSRTILNPQGASVFTENYSHDAHGQMTRMPQLQSLQWDYADRLLASRRQAVDGNDAEGALHQGERTWYVVDGQGVRVRKVTERANGTRMKERLYLGAFELYREYDGSGLKVTLERQTLHVSDGPRRMAMVETLTQGEGARQPLARYQYDNHLGSACLELDDRARVISYEEYTPYGSTSYEAQDASVQAAAKRYRYAGIERDEESGLDAHSLRYCAPWLGRWISCDPAGPVDGPNLYRYAHNAPTSLVDPRGTDPLPPDPEGSGPPPDPNRKVKPEDRKSTPEGSQTQMQNSSTGSNGAAVQPEDTKTSEFTLAPFGAGGSSGGSGGFSFLYHYRQVTSPGKEFGLQLGFGDVGTSDSNTGTGVVAGTLHLGSEPSDALKDTSQTLTGWYFVAGNVWGQNPTLTDPLSTASPRQVGGANPMASAMYAISAMRYGVEEANAETPGPHLHLKSEFDVNFSLLAQRYGAINGVAVGGFVQPSVFLNLALNDVPSDNWQTNIEVGGSVNAGLGGVIPDPTSKSPITGPGATGIPWSVTETLGVGFTYTKGLSAYSIEPYVSHESLPNVATQGGTGSFIDGAWMFGVKFGFGRINSSDDKH